MGCCGSDDADAEQQNTEKATNNNESQYIKAYDFTGEQKNEADAPAPSAVIIVSVVTNNNLGVNLNPKSNELNTKSKGTGELLRFRIQNTDGNGKQLSKSKKNANSKFIQIQSVFNDRYLSVVKKAKEDNIIVEEDADASANANANVDESGSGTELVLDCSGTVMKEAAEDDVIGGANADVNNSRLVFIVHALLDTPGMCKLESATFPGSYVVVDADGPSMGVDGKSAELRFYQ